MSVSAVIVAAGNSKRMDDGIDKLAVELNGKPLLAWTISRFESTEIIDEIIVVTREDEIEKVKELTLSEGFRKVSSIIKGGAFRQQSTQNGLNATSDDSTVVLVHDGARPLIRTSDIERIAESAEENGAALLALPSKESVKEVHDGRVTKTLPRESIWLAQTPQGFRKELLQKALSDAEKEGYVGTDEASLVERIGEEVVVVEGHSSNIKVTVSSDIEVVRSLLEGEEESV
ncbi:2-C-methyl-D-erythritol 4-phosphate cytidylyltransferase [Candidatus Marinimicrobia bacterium MT.SAG.2]|nr:2-C-methyl-D-erythritol 4-phosphate cytidylyltransferase [Candidatus Marinimicrobia bacterium MT.SAG.2]